MVIFIGPPTSGKSSAATLVANDIGANLVRGRDIVPEQTENYGSFRNLIPDNLFIPRLSLLLAKLNGSIVFDNIPRTGKQADYLISLSGYSIITFLLQLSENEVIERTKERLACPVCGETFHPNLKPSRIPGLCDKDSNALTIRPGDKDIEIVIKGYQQYVRLVGELLPHLTQKSKIICIASSGTVRETYRLIMSNINGIND